MPTLRRLRLLVTCLIALSMLFVPIGKYISLASSTTKPTVDAASAILINAQDGTVLYQKDADKPMNPASTTKIMTALLALESGIPLSTLITSGNEVNTIPSDSSLMPLKYDETVTFEDLLYGLMIPSGNDAAVTIATAVSGSVSAFVERMNQRAKELGCTNANFVNPHGYTANGHLISARDLALIMKEVLKQPLFRELISAQSHSVPPTTKRDTTLILRTRNAVIMPLSSANPYFYEPSLGGKTGYTSAAGHTFVSAAEQNGMTLISVVLNTTSTGKWTDSTALFEYGFANYNAVNPMALYMQNPQYVQVCAPEDQDLLISTISLDIQQIDGLSYPSIALSSHTAAQVSQNAADYFTYEWNQPNLSPPVSAGDVVGYAVFSYPGASPQRFELVATQDLDAQSQIALPTAAPGLTSGPGTTLSPAASPSPLDDQRQAQSPGFLYRLFTHWLLWAGIGFYLFLCCLRLVLKRRRRKHSMTRCRGPICTYDYSPVESLPRTARRHHPNDTY